MIDSWNEISIGKTGNVVTGKTPSSKTPHHFGSAMPFVTPSDFGNYHKYIESAERFLSKEGIQGLASKVLPQNSVVVTCIGSDMGKVAMTKVECITNQQINSIICDKEIVDPHWVYYCLKNSYALLRRLAEDGTTMPIVNKGDFEAIRIPFPPLPIQRRIADILGALDDKIECNRRINQTLEAMARTLYKHWFVDKDFETTTLGEMCEILMGQSPSSDHYNDMGKGLPFHQGVTNFGWRFPRHVTYCDELARIAEAGSVLFSVRAPVGRINLTDRRIVIGRGVASMNHKRGWNSFLLYQLKEKFSKEDSIGSGTIFNSVTKSDLANASVVSAPNDLAEKFNTIVAAYDKQIEINEHESDTLTRTRDYLLPKLLSGEVEVEEGALQM